MRVSRHAIDTDAQAWEALSDVLQRKVLNGDPDNGPHTLLLRSGPREPGPDFAQFHPIDEELFALDGDFTFDGSTWFRGGSYAFYPAYFVHGAQVHVRGGYEVYLRLSGVSELFTVDQPQSNEPYFVGEGAPSAPALQFADAMLSAAQATAVGDVALQQRPLHRTAGGQGSTLLTLPAQAVGTSIRLETRGLLEVLTLSGSFRLPGNAGLRRLSYHCEVGEHPSAQLACEAPGTLLISHDSRLTIS